MFKQTYKNYFNLTLVQLSIAVVCSVLLMIVVSLLSPKIVKAAPFTCSNAFYQIINGTLTQLNPSTGQYTTLGSTGSLNTNAVGYNQEDNYLYAIQTIAFGGSNGLVRIEHDGTTTGLGIPTGLTWPAAYVSGDFDNAGNLYVSTSSSTLFKIDVSANTATTIALTASLPINDLVYLNGMLYGLNNTTLFEVNISTGAVTTKPITLTPDPGNPSSVYGAGWAADNSKLFFARNSDGKIFEVSNFTTAGPTAQIVLDGDSATGNDGASCSVATSPIPPFFVANDTGTTASGTPLIVPASQGLLVNDNGRQLTVTSYTQPANGSLVVNPDGSYTFTPNVGFVGTTTFTYTVTDEYGEVETATVTLVITAGPRLANTGSSQTTILALVLVAMLSAGVYLKRSVDRR